MRPTALFLLALSFFCINTFCSATCIVKLGDKFFSLEPIGSLALISSQSKYQLALCNSALPSCPRTGAVGASQCTTSGVAGACRTDATNGTFCLGKAATKTVSLIENGLQIRFTGGDDGTNTTVSVTCDPSVVGQPTDFNASYTQSALTLAFGHASACARSTPPSEVVLNDCFDGGDMAGRFCVQINATGCLYASIAVSRGSGALVPPRTVGIPSLVDHLKELQTAQLAAGKPALPIEECFATSLPTIKVCYRVDNISQPANSTFDGDLDVCASIVVKLLSSTIKALNIGCFKFQSCPLVSCGPTNCNGVGECTPLGCNCTAGYYGSHCEISTDGNCLSLDSSTYCLSAGLTPTCEQAYVALAHPDGEVMANKSFAISNIPTALNLNCENGLILSECRGCLLFDNTKVSSSNGIAMIEGCPRLELQCFGQQVASYKMKCRSISAQIQSPSCHLPPPPAVQPPLAPRFPIAPTPYVPLPPDAILSPDSVRTHEPEESPLVDAGSKWYIIVIAVIVFLALVTVVVYFIRKRREQGYHLQRDDVEPNDIELSGPEDIDDAEDDELKA